MICIHIGLIIDCGNKSAGLVFLMKKNHSINASKSVWKKNHLRKIVKIQLNQFPNCFSFQGVTVVKINLH